MRKISTLCVAALLAFSAMAQSKMSGYSQMMLRECRKVAENHSQNDFAIKAVKEIDGQKCVDAFVRVKDAKKIGDLAALGVKVNYVMGNCCTAQIPLDAVSTVLESDNVAGIEMPHRAHLLNNNAREMTNHNATLAGNEELGISPFTGKGVIYGTMDCGIDFNHINFRHDDGSTRFLAVYLPDNETGEKYTGRAANYDTFDYDIAELPGSVFTTDEAIKGLTSDTPTESHGSHTMGTAAGSYNNAYRGFAPDADLIGCGTINLSDFNIVNSVAYVFDRAEELGRPAVVNLSLGYNVGLHNGNDFLPYMLDRLTGPGKVVCVSAGNEGNDRLHLAHTFADGQPLKTVVKSNSWSGFSGEITIYSQSDIKAKVIITADGGQLYSASTAYCSNENPTIDLPDGLKAGFSGSIALYYTEGTDLGNEIYIKLDGSVKNSGNVALIVEGEDGSDLQMWCESYTEFSDGGGWTGYTGGDTNMSISTMACGKEAISVGAYYSRGGSPGALTYFSSYGPTSDGRTKPDIVGPGSSLYSSVNSYDSSSTGRSAVAQATVDGTTYYWGSMQGTSMSCPAVSGVIATWLELNREMTPADIKEVFAATAQNDNITAKNPEKWGYGKIDSFEGIKHIYQTLGVSDVVAEKKPLIIYPNPSDGRFTVLAANEEAVTVNVYNLGGALVASQKIAA
ncbi:MAG: S8 family serine peptidase, partial [Muribaculaceae bacterium]